MTADHRACVALVLSLLLPSCSEASLAATPGVVQADAGDAPTTDASADQDTSAEAAAVVCRDESWRDEFLRSLDAQTELDESGRVVFALSADRTEVVLDPYGLTPLSAVVALSGIAKPCVRSVSIFFEGIEGENIDVTLPYDESYAKRYECPELAKGKEVVQVPILGLHPERSHQIRISVSEGGAVHRASIALTTGSLPVWLPTVEVVTAKRDKMEPGWNLAGFSAGENGFKGRPFFFDLQGHIRWVLLADKAVSPGFVSPMEPLRDGNLVMAFGNTVYEYSLLGREVQRWLLPEDFEQDHDVYEMPDGNLLVCGRGKKAKYLNGEGKELTASDQVVEIDRATGAVRNRWDLRLFLDVDRYTYMKIGSGTDWFHLNSVWYMPEEDTILVSGKHQGVAKLTRGGVNLQDPQAGKELRWILAPHLGWGKAGWDGTGQETMPYLLTAVEEDGTAYSQAVQEGKESSAKFGWPFGQHAVMDLGEGQVFVFDNGEGRDLKAYTGKPFSRGVIYRIKAASDGVGGTVQQVWELGREYGAELYAPVISDVDVGATTGNRLLLPGSYTTQADGTPGGVAKMLEVRAADSEVVFEARILMRGTGAWGGDIVYRQERMKLYQ